MPDDSSQPFRVLDRASQVEIFLHGEIVPGMAEPYACTLTAAGSKPVLVRLHSPGGDWLEASAMYSATERHPGRTVGLVEGLAASSASFLLQAFNERRINANGIMMVHPPYMAVSGRAEDHASAVEALTAVRTRLAAAYRRSGQPAAVIEEWVTRESWFTAGEALGAGLVDAIDAPARVAVSLDVT